MFNDIKNKKRNLESPKDSFFEIDDEIFSSLISSDKLAKKHQNFLIKIKKIKSDIIKKINKKYLKHKITKKLHTVKNSRPKFKVSHKTTIFLGLAILALIFGLKFLDKTKPDTEVYSQEAEDHIWAAFSYLETGDLSNAANEANLAKSSLEKIKLKAQSFGQDTLSLKLLAPEDSKIVAYERLLNAAYLVCSTFSDTSNNLINFDNSIESSIKFTNESNRIFFDIATNQQTILKAINQSKSNISQAMVDLDNAQRGLPSKTKSQIEAATTTLNNTIDYLNFIELLVDKDLAWLSGANGEDKNIMIIFQNNSELRGASGGSLGSFGIARFKNGALQNIDFGKNIFKIDQAFEKTNRFYEPPDPIKFLRGDKTWTLKDSGWDVNGPDAMKNIEKFYYIETGEKLDGVLMVDSTVIINLLKVIGPIKIPNYDGVIDSENFKEKIETEVHKGYFQSNENLIENEPKKIISDMMPIFLDKLSTQLNNKETTFKVLNALSDSLKQKDITMYFNKIDFQKRIEKMNYSGKINTAFGDYLSVNNSNIDGAKSSLNMKENLYLKINIDKKGKTKNELTLERSHEGDGEWPDGINRNFVRLLLPENSKIENFSPITGNYEQMGNKGYQNETIFNEEKNYGKKLLNFWMTTDPKETSKLNIQYSTGLEFDLKKNFMYDLVLQKQVGASPDFLTLEINYPEGFRPINVKNYDEKNHKIIIKTEIITDKRIKINFTKIN